MDSESHRVFAAAFCLVEDHLGGLLLKDGDGLVTCHGHSQLLAELDKVGFAARCRIELGHAKLQWCLALRTGVGRQAVSFAKLLHANHAFGSTP